MDSGISGPPVTSRSDEGMPETQAHGVHANALRIRAFWSETGRTPGCFACETPGPVKSRTRECRSYQDAWDESRRTASAEEAKRGIVADPDTRPLDPSGSSLDPEPKRTETTSATDNENPADQMDEDNFRRAPATSHQLEPVDDENVSKKARVARNVLHIRGEDSVKFDVNEEAWPFVFFFLAFLFIFYCFSFCLRFFSFFCLREGAGPVFFEFVKLINLATPKIATIIQSGEAPF